jgi:hypothetical protein
MGDKDALQVDTRRSGFADAAILIGPRPVHDTDRPAGIDPLSSTSHL